MPRGHPTRAGFYHFARIAPAFRAGSFEEDQKHAHRIHDGER
jgi:hypothetical protein